MRAGWWPRTTPSNLPGSDRVERPIPAPSVCSHQPGEVGRLSSCQDQVFRSVVRTTVAVPSVTVCGRDPASPT